jgi:hypothetical protein
MARRRDVNPAPAVIRWLVQLLMVSASVSVLNVDLLVGIPGLEWFRHCRPINIVKTMEAPKTAP